MTQEIAIVDKDEEVKKNSAPKRVTTQNVWDEIESLKAKIEALYSVIDASNHAKIDPEMLETPAADKLAARLDAIESKITAVDSLGEKLDAISSELGKVPSIGTIEGMRVQLEVFGKKLDSLTEELQAASEKNESAQLKPELWWGAFSVATPIIAVGAVISVVPGVSVLAGIGVLLAGGILGAISAMKLWFSPKKNQAIDPQ